MFDRCDLLDTLRPIRIETNNAILIDFVDHLEAIETAVRAYATARPEAWDERAWKGFYTALHEELPDGHWAYVPNPTGGFMGFWWGWHDVAGGEVYLQLEQDKLVIKVAAADKAGRSELRDRWVARTLEAMSRFGFERPAKLGHGSYMTVAVMKEEDYRRYAGDRLDFAATVEVLREATSQVTRLVGPSG